MLRFSSPSFQKGYGKRGLWAVELLLLLGVVCSCTLPNQIDGAASDGESLNLENSVVLGATSPSGEKKDMYYEFSDDNGHLVQFSKKPETVIALSGSLADIWVLAGGSLAAVTDDVLKEKRIDIAPDTAVIGTAYKPNQEAILALKPDFVILSPDISAHRALESLLNDSGIAYGYFAVDSFSDYLDMLRICTEITDNVNAYTSNGLEVEKEVNRVLEAVPEGTPPRVLFIRASGTSLEVKGSDSITGQILKDLGAINLADGSGVLAENLSLETIIQSDPDYIFAVTMGGDQDAALAAIKSTFQDNPAWANLTAVKNNHYVLLPKELFHYKPNRKWGESYAYLAKILYPEVFVS